MRTLHDYANVLSRFDIRKRTEKEATAICPAHDDTNPSLAFFINRDGERLILKCFAGCNYNDILACVELDWRSCLPPLEKRYTDEPKPKISAIYSYLSAGNVVLYQEVRFEPGFNGARKSPRMRKPDGSGGWVWNVDGVEKVLYNLPEILTADENRIVWIVGGPKNAKDGYDYAGLLATTNSGGEGSRWLPQYSQTLAGRDVVIVPDNDSTGWLHAEAVAGSLLVHGAASIRVLKLPGLAAKGDLSDWFRQRPNASRNELRAELWELVRATPSYSLKRGVSL